MNTRFNPTVNGPLHIGHLYMILVNEYMAHSTGGRFIMRLEDNQPYWETRIGAEKIKEYIEGMQEDLDWFGIKVDEWTYQSELQPAVEREIMWRNKGPLPVARMEEGPRMIQDTSLGAPVYPYMPWLTAATVIMDYHDSIDCLVRGKDMETQASLYFYLCEIWGLPFPYHWYLPRLSRSAGYDSVSKTVGGYTIQEYRTADSDGAETLLLNLSHWCKKDPSGPWNVGNIKDNPCVSSAQNG